MLPTCDLYHTLYWSSWKKFRHQTENWMQEQKCNIPGILHKVQSQAVRRKGRETGDQLKNQQTPKRFKKGRLDRHWCPFQGTWPQFWQGLQINRYRGDRGQEYDKGADKGDLTTKRRLLGLETKNPGAPGLQRASQFSEWSLKIPRTTTKSVKKSGPNDCMKT